MWTQAYEAYLQEMTSHCEAALDAMGELSFSVLNLRRLAHGSKRYHDFHNRIFHSIYLFLTHAGAVSVMLWPEIHKESDENGFYIHSKNSITNTIKKGLTPVSRANLNNRHLRTKIKFTLEQRQRMGEQEDFRNDIVSPCLGFSGTPLAKEICAYDPISRIFYLYGESIKIDDLTVAVYELLNCIRKETEKRKRPSPVLCETSARVNT